MRGARAEARQHVRELAEREPRVVAGERPSATTASTARRPLSPIAARGCRPSVMSESNWLGRGGEALGVLAVAADDARRRGRAAVRPGAGRRRGSAGSASRRSMRTIAAPVDVQARPRRVPRGGERHVRDGAARAGAARRAGGRPAACRTRRRGRRARPCCAHQSASALLRREPRDAHAHVRARSQRATCTVVRRPSASSGRTMSRARAPAGIAAMEARVFMIAPHAPRPSRRPRERAADRQTRGPAPERRLTAHVRYVRFRGRSARRRASS